MLTPACTYRRFALASLLGCCILSLPAECGESAGTVSDAPSYRAAIHSDWAAQERRLGRSHDTVEAIQAALARGERLLAGLVQMPDGPDVRRELEELGRLRKAAEACTSLDKASRISLYKAIRWLVRNAAFKNPLVAGKPLVFLHRRRFISQMLHEYLGYYYDYGNIDGGVYVLEAPCRSMERRDLIQGRLPRGNYTTLALSYDAKTVYFAFCERAPSKPNYYTVQRRAFHLYAVDVDGRNLRQLTSGPDDDFDPCPLPDGDLAFMSTRRGGFGRCHNPWEPLPAYTLHRLDREQAKPPWNSRGNFQESSKTLGFRGCFMEC